MIYTIKNDKISLSVMGKGACMTSLVYLPENEERLWQGEEFWKSQDVVIFPILGHAGHFEAKGNTYSPRSHGIARYSEFSVADKGEDHITLNLKSSEDTLKEYPYEFDFSITYALRDNGVEITYSVKGVKENIPFYVGGHPGMKAPKAEVEFYFENEENLMVYPIDKDRAYPLEGVKSFKVDKQFFKDVKTYQIGNLSGGAVYAYTKDGYMYTYRSNCPILAFWSHEEGGDYICVEPWWGINDFPTFPREITLKPFINFAGPEGKTYTYKLSVEKI